MTKLRALERIQNILEQHEAFLSIVSFHDYAEFQVLYRLKQFDGHKYNRCPKNKKNLGDHLWHCCIGAKKLKAHQTEVVFLKLQPGYNPQKIQSVFILIWNYIMASPTLTGLNWTMQVKSR